MAADAGRARHRFGRTKEGEDLTSPDQVKKRNAAKNLAAQSVLATMEVRSACPARHHVQQRGTWRSCPPEKASPESARAPGQAPATATVRSGADGDTLPRRCTTAWKRQPCWCSSPQATLAAGLWATGAV